MKLGAEDKKKVYALGGLFVLLGYFVYANVFSSSSPSSSSAPAASRRESAKAAPSPALGSPDTEGAAHPAGRGNKARSDEFIPVLHSKRPEDQIDPMSVDPTLHLARLAKLQDVGSAGSGRNLFAMGEAPRGPEPVVAVKAAGHSMGPTEVYVPPPPGPPPPPPLPPITFKYYGFSTVRKDGKKTGFFLIGTDEVTVRAAGEMVDRTYRLVSIGLTSAVVEDTQSKRTQTVPLAEEAQS